MQLNKEFIEAQKLTPEQVTALVEATNNREAEIKKTYDGKANQDAEALGKNRLRTIILQRVENQTIATDVTPQSGMQQTPGNVVESVTEEDF